MESSIEMMLQKELFSVCFSTSAVQIKRERHEETNCEEQRKRTICKYSLGFLVDLSDIFSRDDIV